MRSLQPRVWILNGPNLNLLGTREPEIYGHQTLADVEALCRIKVEELGMSLEAFRQSNHEGVLVDWIQEAKGKAEGLLLNAGAYTHTSVAILDALKGVEIPCVEIHLSDPSKREEFRHISFVGMAAVGEVKGLGVQSYIKGLEVLKSYLEQKR